MGSDRARVSFDPSRHWRAVVAQQGRVTLEADWNEAAAIAAAEQRAELLDIVGPAGTPDDGYRITPAAGGDFVVGPGTMYVGGERVWLDKEVEYGAQPEWEDRAGDPLWVEPGQEPAGAGYELVYLLVREQEVSAVEDPALREVALGGPDTAQRTRLVQRVVRRPTEHDDCAGAWAEQVEAWHEEGMHFDPASMRLESTARLQVSFEDPGDTTDVCEPDAQGGYLGAENQLIRVQVCDGVEGEASIVWGYDNASFLYRVAEPAVDASAGSTTLTLASRPVDDHHQPRQGQEVEVLRAAVRLTADDHVAAPAGVIAALAAPYNPDTRQVVLPVVLPPEYLDRDLTPLLYLRVWEQRLACPPDTPIPLGDTGVVVTLTTTGGEPFHVGDHWMIAVRPATPVQVYPQRLLQGFESPAGYLVWACPLAVLSHRQEQLRVEADCRNHFDNLVELTRREGGGGCCRLTVGPADVAGGARLQDAVDRLAGKGPATLCLRPGTYVLEAPLVLTHENDRLTIEGCNEAAVLEASPAHVERFVQGLLVLQRANGVTLRGLRFRMPQVPFAGSGGKVAGMAEKAAHGFLSFFRNLHVSIAIRPVHCALLRVERCLFRYTLTEDAGVFAVGIFAASECWGLAVDRCRFLRDEERELLLPQVEGQRAQFPFHVLLGYLLVPTTAFNPTKRGDPAVRGGSVVRSLLHDATFRDNLFEGITVPAIVVGELGTSRIESNTVRECYGGFWLISHGTSTKVAAFNRLPASEAIASAIFNSFQDPVLLFAVVVGRVYPVPDDQSVHAVAVAGGRAPTADEERTEARAFLDRIVAPAARGTPADDAGAATVGDMALAGASDAVVELINANIVLVAFLRIAYAEAGASVNLRLDVTGNQIDAVVERSLTGAALMVWDNDDAVGSITLTGNRLRSRSPGRATASILNVDRCTVTGNIISNEAP